MPRHTKKHLARKHRKMRGGFYSFGGDILGNNVGAGSGAAAWSAGSEMGQFAVDKGGNIGNMGPSGPRPAIQYGRGRRKTRGRKTRRRMRGGSKYGAVSASFDGTGYRGIQNAAQVNTKFPPFGGAQHGAFNDGAAASMKAGNSFDILPK